MQKPTDEALQSRALPSYSLYTAIALAVLGVLYMGIFPSGMIEALQRSATSLIAGG